MSTYFFHEAVGPPYNKMNLQVTHKPKRDYGHFGHHQKEGESGLGGGGKSPPWFQPPPISPDIPPLFYEDAHKAEGNLAEENEKLKLLPVVKSLGEQGRNSTGFLLDILNLL